MLRESRLTTHRYHDLGFPILFMPLWARPRRRDSSDPGTTGWHSTAGSVYQGSPGGGEGCLLEQGSDDGSSVTSFNTQLRASTFNESFFASSALSRVTSMSSMSAFNVIPPAHSFLTHTPPSGLASDGESNISAHSWKNGHYNTISGFPTAGGGLSNNPINQNYFYSTHSPTLPRMLSRLNYGGSFTASHNSTSLGFPQSGARLTADSQQLSRNTSPTVHAKASQQSNSLSQSSAAGVNNKSTGPRVDLADGGSGGAVQLRSSRELSFEPANSPLYTHKTHIRPHPLAQASLIELNHSANPTHPVDPLSSVSSKTNVGGLARRLESELNALAPESRVSVSREQVDPRDEGLPALEDAQVLGVAAEPSAAEGKDDLAALQDGLDSASTFCRVVCRGIRLHSTHRPSYPFCCVSCVRCSG